MEDSQILRKVEDKVNQMLGTVLRKDTIMSNRMPTGGSVGDYKLVTISGETRLCYKTDKGWMYTVLHQQQPDQAGDDTELTISGKVNAEKGFTVTDAYVGLPVGYIIYISDLKWSGATLQYKTRQATVVGGIVISISNASAWKNVP